MAPLRGGRLAFLFADIEGSTGLAARLGERWADVLEDVRETVRRAVGDAGGHEVDCHGDELFAVFEAPPAAISAALAIQYALRDRAWPEPLRMRVGVHVGEAVESGAGYVGVDVHRAARIASAGHGGQIVLSEAAAAVAPRARELGAYELEGIAEPERLFQLLEPGLPSEFPPLRSLRRVDAAELRVALADDSVLLREGIALMLEEAGMRIVSQAGTAEELLVHVESLRPHVAITDIRMPPTRTDEGLRAAKEIRARFPEIGAVALSQHLEPDYALELVAASPTGIGYLLKDSALDADEFAAAVTRVATGGVALDPAIVSELVARKRANDPLASLDARGRELVRLLAEGRSNEAIAERLVAPLAEVEEEVAALLASLGLDGATVDRRVLSVLELLES